MREVSCEASSMVNRCLTLLCNNLLLLFWDSSTLTIATHTHPSVPINSCWTNPNLQNNCLLVLLFTTSSPVWIVGLHLSLTSNWDFFWDWAENLVATGSGIDDGVPWRRWWWRWCFNFLVSDWWALTISKCSIAVNLFPVMRCEKHKLPLIPSWSSAR